MSVKQKTLANSFTIKGKGLKGKDYTQVLMLQCNSCLLQSFMDLSLKE